MSSDSDVDYTEEGVNYGHAEDRSGHRTLKEKIKHPLPHTRDKLLHSHMLQKAEIKVVHTKNKLGKFKNLVNTNHRHDEEHEQATDRKREQIRSGHRFNSFAPEREGNLIKWYVDGRDYFWVCGCYRRTIVQWTLMGRPRPYQRRWRTRKRPSTSRTGGSPRNWWVVQPSMRVPLTVRQYLRRPPFYNQEWRLDNILKRKAEEGVKIYVVVYKEVSQLAPHCQPQSLTSGIGQASPHV